MSSTYLLNPENQAYIDGKQAYPARFDAPSGCVLAFVWLFPLMGLFFIVVGLSYVWAEVMLILSPSTTQGIVVQLTVEEESEGTLYRVFYSYSVADERYLEKQEVSADVYANLRVEQRIAIEYLASHPRVARLQGTNNWGVTLFLLGFSAVWMLLTTLFAFSFQTRYSRLRRLRYRGTRLQAQLIDFERKPDPDSDDDVQFILAFISPHGQTIKGKRKYSFASATPPTDATLYVQYLTPKNWEVL